MSYCECEYIVACAPMNEIRTHLTFFSCLLPPGMTDLIDLQPPRTRIAHVILPSPYYVKVRAKRAKRPLCWVVVFVVVLSQPSIHHARCDDAVTFYHTRHKREWMEDALSVSFQTVNIYHPCGLVWLGLHVKDAYVHTIARKISPTQPLQMRWRSPALFHK